MNFLRQAFLVRQLAFYQKKPISYLHLKGLLEKTRSNQDHKQDPAYSILEGICRLQQNSLPRSYDIAQSLKSRLEPLNARQQLIDLLFNKNGQLFHTTNSSSNIASSLTPEIIAHLMVYLESYRALDENIPFDHTETANKIYQLWKEAHFIKTKSKLTVSKFNAFLNAFLYTKKDALEAGNPLEKQYAEVLLLSFLSGKAENSEEILSYFQHLNRLKNPEGKESFLPKFETFTPEDLRIGREKLENLQETFNYPEMETILEENYEQIMAYLLLKEKDFYLPEVFARGYAYQSSAKRPSCVETAFQNLFNILLLSPEKNCFDPSVLPEKLKLNEKLSAFYAAEDFKVDNINTVETGQAFFNLLSGLENISYYSKNFEVGADANNFLPMMNHFFKSETPATSLEELSANFSDDKRKIQFSRDGENIYIKITRINNEQEQTCEELVLHIVTARHAELIAERFREGMAKGVDQVRLIPFAYKCMEKYPLLFPTVLRNGTFGQNLDIFVGLAKADNRLSLFDLYLIFMNSPLSSSHNDMYHFFNLHMQYLAAYPEDTELVEYYLSIYCRNFPAFAEELALAGAHRGDKGIKSAVRANANFEHIFERVVSYRNSLEVIQTLIEGGANPNCADSAGNTQLHLSTSPDVLKFLLLNGANPALSNAFGFTALDLACRKSDVVKVQTLLEAGVNPNTKNAKGVTSLEYAKSPDIIELLQKYATPVLTQEVSEEENTSHRNGI